MDSNSIESEQNVHLLANPNFSLQISLHSTLIIKHIFANQIMMFDTLSLVGHSYFMLFYPGSYVTNMYVIYPGVSTLTLLCKLCTSFISDIFAMPIRDFMEAKRK